METLSVLNSRKKNTITRLNRNSKIIKSIIRAIQNKKGEKVVSLDLRKIPEASADFFIVCEASSTTQVKAICDEVEFQVKQDCDEMQGYRCGQPCDAEALARLPAAPPLTPPLTPSV